MNIPGIATAVALLFAFSLSAAAQTVERRDSSGISFSYRGFVDSYHSFRSKSDFDYMAGRTRLRLEGSAEKWNVTAFASINAVYNSVVEKRSGVFLREAFIGYRSGGWDIKAGRQIIVWGVADALCVTDLFSPMDYTEFLARDYDDIRIPVGAVRIGYGKSSFHIEGIFVPVPEVSVFPTDDSNPWSLQAHGIGLALDENKPQRKFKNSQAGVKASFFLRGADISICAMRTINPVPAISIKGLSPDIDIVLKAHYSQMTTIGATASIPFGKFVARFEAAEHFGELQNYNYLFNDKRINDMGDIDDLSDLGYNDYIITAMNLFAPYKTMSKNTTKILAGLDWYPGNNWVISAQYKHKIISDYDERIFQYRNSSVGTLDISKELFNNQLKLSAMGRFDCSSNFAFFTRFKAEYVITDQISLFAGYDWFNAKHGEMMIYKDNSEFFVKAKYSF